MGVLEHCRQLVSLNGPLILYRHDCPACRLVGVNAGLGEDIYVCWEADERTLVRRYGDSERAYLSLPKRQWRFFEAQPEWRSAIYAARRDGQESIEASTAPRMR